MIKKLIISGVAILLVSCSSMEPKPMMPSTGHIKPQQAPPAVSIPAPVTRMPILAAPEPEAPVETYTVVVRDVPVGDLLFALARDAKMNVDIHPGIEGNVTLNAIDQTLPQILDRLSKQINIKYKIQDNVLAVSLDTPYFSTYKIDYLNIERASESNVDISTKVAATSLDLTAAGGGSGGSDSDTSLTNKSQNMFWTSLEENIQSLLGEEGNIISNREAGVIVVKANSKQHQVIQEFVDLITTNARRQVLIEATIVEVELNDSYQSGINWARVATPAIGKGLSLLGGAATTASGATGALATLATNVFTANTNAPQPSFVLDYQQNANRNDGVSLTVSLLKEFGNTRVLSSPKMMTLNNQTALLKVVENQVYFTIETETIASTGAGVAPIVNQTSTIHTIPIGVLMQITPQISKDGTVILNVRPTITRLISTVADPVNAGNNIPQVAVREMESILLLNSGQIAVLGGLMQDSDARDTSGLPGLADIDGIGEAFKSRRNKASKTELVVFLKPMIINQPSINSDLIPFRKYLSDASKRVFNPDKEASK